MLSCDGVCLSSADCASSGRQYTVGSCGEGDAADDTVCCKEATPCTYVGFDGESVSGKCQSASYCDDQGMIGFEIETCADAAPAAAPAPVCQRTGALLANACASERARVCRA